MIRIRKSDLIQILREATSQENPDDYVTVTASDGEEVKLYKNMSGLETGWAVIANPGLYRDEPDHPFHNPDWKMKDGETVIGVPKDWDGPGGEVMTVADAYQEHRAQMAIDRAEYEGWMKDIEDEQRDEIQAWHDEEGARLSGIEAEEERMRAPESEYDDTPSRQRARRFEGKMKITKKDLRRIIKEEVSSVLKEITNIDSGELRDIASTAATTADGREAMLVFTGIVEHDDASGEFYYKIGDDEHEWEFHSGYNEAGAVDHIMDALGFDSYDDANESIDQQLNAWLKSLKIRANYGNQSRW